MKTKDGGPAFPSVSNGYMIHAGMSLRDWFAGQALAGDWASQSAELGQFLNSDRADSMVTLALAYYHAADAMLAAREEKQ